MVRQRSRLLLSQQSFQLYWYHQYDNSTHDHRVRSSFTITYCDLRTCVSSILAVWNLFWAMVASFAVERVGRRWLFNTSCAGMLVFFTMQTICSAQFALHGTQAAAHAVIAFIFLYYAVYE